MQQWKPILATSERETEMTREVILFRFQTGGAITTLADVFIYFFDEWSIATPADAFINFDILFLSPYMFL